MKNSEQKMVGWYDPAQLLNTAGKTVISTVIGENADQRLTNASLTHQPIFDYSVEFKATEFSFEEISGSERKEIWIDYVADVGDGWQSTAAVAYHLAKGSMPKGFSPAGSFRGELMIFGGDEVYPTGCDEEYQRRLITPYTFAATEAGIAGGRVPPGTEVDLKSAPHVFAIPGNHDWYDSLNAFRYVFCAPYFTKRVFATGWRTMQKRSYFALKLPCNWWLFGVDLQLTHNIDWAQLEYFKNILQNRTDSNGRKLISGPRFEPGSNVIICSPEPLWIEEEKDARAVGLTKSNKDRLNLVYLEQMIEDAGSSVRLYLAGDSHHYRRFASADGQVQKITAGGGGAFLHPTHDIDFDKITDGKMRTFSFCKAYPETERSRSLGYRNLAFLLINPSFGLVTAILYCLVVWLAHNTVPVDQNPSWKLVSTIAAALIDQPLLVLTIAALVAALIFFTDTRSRLQKYLGGSLHAIAHLGACLLLGLGGYQLFRYCFSPQSMGLAETWVQWLVTGSFVFIGGWIVGSIIMGLYLLISLQAFGRHANEAFSSLKITDCKNFLRLHISDEGLKIYPIKIDKIGRHVKDTKVDFIESQTILLSNAVTKNQTN